MSGAFLGLLAKVGLRADIPPPEIPNFEPRVEESDDSEMVAVDDSEFGGNENIRGVLLAIHYRDAQGQETNRRIECHKFRVHANSVTLAAYCYERDAERTFRVDRIAQIIDLNTGEVFEDAMVYLTRFANCAALPDGLLAGKRASPGQRRAMTKSRDGIRILVFLARCDGEYHSKERAAIADYIRARCGELEYDIDALLDYADHQYPDEELYFSTLDEIEVEAELDGDDHLRLLLSAVVAVIEADGKITDEEFEFASEIQTIAEEIGAI